MEKDESGSSRIIKEAIERDNIEESSFSKHFVHLTILTYLLLFNETNVLTNRLNMAG